MRTCWCKWVAAASFGSMLIMASAASLAQLPQELRVDLDLKDADVQTAIQVLARETGMMFIFEPTADPIQKVTAHLNRVTVEDAVRYICQSAGLSYRRDENGAYILSKKKVADAEFTAAQPNTVKAPGPKIVQKFKLRKADPQEVLNQLKGGDPLDPSRTFERLTRFQRTSQVNGSQLWGNGPMLNGGNNPYNNFQPVSTSTLPRGTESGSNIMLPGESGGQGGGLAGGGQGGGGLGGGGQGGFGGGGQGGGFGQGGGGFQLGAGQGLVGSSITYISYDPNDNSIVVQGTEEDIADLQRYISMFDVAPQQVIIKVEFITTSSSLSKALGFDWLYERGPLITGNRPGSFARAGDPFFLSYATGAVTARMRALLQQGYGKVVQAPIIRTLNNQPASVQQNVLTTIFVSQVVGTGNGTVIVAPQPFQITITTGLNVAPRINGDGTVTVYLLVPVQDFGQLRRSPDGTEFPDVLTQVISVVARVKSGETIALGGLVRKQDTGSQARFPILGDLPLIGQFFRASSRDRNNTELLIFVTPTIVEDDSSGGLGP